MRAFDTAFPRDFLKGYQAGVMKYRYRDVPCLRSPIDMAIQACALWEMKPATLIEIGSHSGGGALWLADMAEIYGLNAHVWSIDLKAPAIEDPRITFLEGDVLALQTVFTTHGLAACPRPWYVIEDSAHSYAGCRAALEVLSRQMRTGDLLVMEDGVLDDLGLTERYDGGPNRAISEYMEECPGVFKIDTALCDMFGTNATYAPNGYLRKA